MTKPTTKPPEAEPADFAAFLVNHREGKVNAVISEEMHALLQAVSSLGKKGSLAIKVIVEPGKGHVEGDPLVISIETDLKAPKPTVAPAVYFVDEIGHPTRNDPRQTTAFDLADVRTAPTTDTTEARSAH